MQFCIWNKIPLKLFNCADTMNKQNKMEYRTPESAQILLRAESPLCVSGSISKLKQEENLFDWADDDDPAV